MRDARTTGVPRSTLTPGQLESFRRSLIDRITNTFHNVHADIRRAQDPPPTPERGDEGDESLAAQLKDLEVYLDEREARLAQAMEEALRRIGRGEYGMCIDCGNPIELERLRLIPWALRCADDQEAFEAETQQHPPTL
jgi:DnaK suppressor protein